VVGHLLPVSSWETEGKRGKEEGGREVEMELDISGLFL